MSNGRSDTMETLPPTKVCNKCKETKPRTPEYFYNFKYAKDGMNGNCKTCVNTDAVKHRENNVKSHLADPTMQKPCKQCGEIMHRTWENTPYWERRKCCSRECSVVVTGMRKGQPLPKHIHAGMANRTYTDEGLQKIRETRKLMSGDRHPNWKGGELEKTCTQCGTLFTVKQYRKETANFCSPECKIKAQDKGLTTEDKRIRQSAAYAKWRKAVFERDNYTCTQCGIRNGIGVGKAIILQADHIKPFSLFPDLRFAIDNGRTLCLDCHKETETYGPKIKKSSYAQVNI